MPSTLAQPVHNRIGNCPGRNFAVELVLDPTQGFGQQGVDLLGVDRPLGNRSSQAHGQFCSIKALSPAVSLHHCEIFMQDLLDSRKAMPALQAFPSPASRSNLAGSRLENLQVIRRALRTDASMIKDSIYHTLMCLTEFQEVLQDHNSFFGGKGFGMELNAPNGEVFCV